MDAIKRLFRKKDEQAPAKPSHKEVLARAKKAIAEAEKTCEVFDRNSGILVTPNGKED